MSIAFYWLYAAAWVFFELSFPYNVSTHPIDKTAEAKFDPALTGKYRLWSDTSKLNHFDIKKGLEKTYHISYMSRGGTHRWLELDAEMSQVKSARFLNLRCICDEGCTCYMLLKLLPGKDNNFAAAIVNGSPLQKMKDGKGVLAFLEKNLDNPAIYQDTLHFSKIGSGPMGNFSK